MKYVRKLLTAVHSLGDIAKAWVSVAVGDVMAELFTRF
jgi:hypothetical protein